MKNLRISIFFCFLIGLFHAAYAQPDTLWTKTYGGPDLDILVSIQQTTDGGYIMAGGLAAGGQTGDYWLVKTNAQGDTLWTRTYGGTSWENCGSMQMTSDGGFILVGATESFGVNDRNIWLVRTDSNGDTLWTKTFEKSLLSDANSVVQTSDSGFIVAGIAGTYDEGSNDVWLIRTDSDGDTLWTKTYGGTGDQDGRFVQQTADGGYIIIANKRVADGNVDIWLLKTDANGDTTWTSTFSTGSDGEGTNVVQTADSGYAIFGIIFGTLDAPAPDGDDRDWLLIKTDSLGVLEWSQTYGEDLMDQSFDMLLTDDGGFLLTGALDLTASGNSWDLWLVRANSLGDTVWTTTVGDIGDDAGTGLLELAEGEYAVVGITSSWGAGDLDGWLVRFGDPTAITTPVMAGVPETFALYANYPNPFNPSTTMRFDLPQAMDVRIAVYDLLGREVIRLVDGRIEQGYHQVVWNGMTANGSELPTGVYIARLVTPEYSKSIKMVLLK